MGWKLNLGLAAAALVAVVAFRNQIGGLFGQAGTALGSGISTGFANFIGGLTGPLTQRPENWLGPWNLLGDPDQDGRPGSTGGSSTTKTYVPNIIKIGSSTTSYTDKVVTPATRESSDSFTYKGLTGDAALRAKAAGF
jgi:hypothetical protein